MTCSTDREILTIEEAAQLLGVSVKTFNKVLHAQSIPARKIGREWKFSRRALIEWVGSGRSNEFYREPRDNSGSNGHDPADSHENGENGASVKSSEGRRTSGWSLELD